MQPWLLVSDSVMESTTVFPLIFVYSTSKGAVLSGVPVPLPIFHTKFLTAFADELFAICNAKGEHPAVSGETVNLASI